MNIPDQKRLEEIWAEVPADYYFRLNYLQRLWHDWKWMIIKHLVTQSGKSPKTILEVGCSGGHLAGLMQQLFPKAKITGIDVYEPAVKEAKKRFPKITFLVADAHKLPFKNNTFDLVYCSETIEHVVDPGLMLHEISRVMKKDGEALVEMDSGSPLFRIVWYFWTKFGKGIVWKDAHLHPFTSKELEAVINSNGFAIKEKMFSHFGMAVSFLVNHKN
jgi:ubiquinone/menaquinone biosynthesis C-methylase UbiE